MESFLTHAGYGALALFGFLEACCVPISSEVTFGFAGVLAYQGHLSLPFVIGVGTLAELAGSCVSYTVGRMAERSAIERLGRFVLINRADIDRSAQFLLSRGAWAIPVGRALPFVRSFTSVAAGSAGVPALRFGVLSLIGTAIYAAGMSTLGYVVGSAWHRCPVTCRWQATCWPHWRSQRSWPWSFAGCVRFAARPRQHLPSPPQLHRLMTR